MKSLLARSARSACASAAILCISTPVHTFAADIALALRATAAFECSALATNAADENKLLLLGLEAGRRYFDGMSRTSPDLGDVGQLPSTLFINVVHFEYRETGSSDFAVGAVQAAIRQQIYEEVDRISKFYTRDDRDVRQEEFAKRNCVLL